MIDYELLGIFYLGKMLEERASSEDLLLYHSRELLHHAICIGDDGTGKTALSIAFIEEAAIDNIPVIAIDTKGELSNLFLSFPELRAENFLPWIDGDEARRNQISAEELSVREAQRWRDGLEASHQDSSRIERLRQSAVFEFYTPASSLGISISLQAAFSPDAELVEDRELLKERVRDTVTSILSFAGFSVDLRSKEHILLSSILENCWKSGKDLDLHALVSMIQKPPVLKFGALDLESFFPSDERNAFAVQINNLLVSTEFESWNEGEALDISKLLYDSKGKNKVSVISVSHLHEAERMFFVSLLLTQLISWMRRQSGTSSLRAMIYLDSFDKYFPANSTAPSSAPLLQLLKEAGDYGLGLLLSTKASAELDYEALAGVETWILGRIIDGSERKRALEALQRLNSKSGVASKNENFDQSVANMTAQTFLIHSSAQRTPALFKTRWTLSYLRGKLSRAQLKSLKTIMSVKLEQELEQANPAATRELGAQSERENLEKQSSALPKESVRQEESGLALSQQTPADTKLEAAPEKDSQLDGNQKKTAQSEPAQSKHISESSRGKDTESKTVQPQAVKVESLSPKIIQRFANIGRSRPDDVKLVYKPMLLGSAHLSFINPNLNVDCVKEFSFLYLIKTEQIGWDKGLIAQFPIDSLKHNPDSNIELPGLPDCAKELANYDRWKAEFLDWMQSKQQLEVYRCSVTKLVSSPQESEAEFRNRIKHAAREKRDTLVAALTERYQKMLADLEYKQQYAERLVNLDVGQQDSLAKKNEEAQKGFGNSIFQSLVGRKVPAKLMSEEDRMRKASGIEKMGEVQDEILRYQDYADKIQDQISGLQFDFQKQLSELKAKFDNEPMLETFSVPSVQGSIKLRAFCLCWTPCFRQLDGKVRAAW